MDDINKHATLYVKMFILLSGLLLAVVGMAGLIMDYATEYNIHPGNSGWALMAAGVALMAVAAALYIILPALRERTRHEAIRRQYMDGAITPDSDVEVSALVHRIKENLNLMSIRSDMVVSAADYCKARTEPVDEWRRACIKNMEDAMADGKVMEQYAHNVAALTESLNNYIRTPPPK